MTVKSHAKFEEKITFGFKNDMRNLANFHQNTRKCQNWYFHGILLSKVKNAWAKNLQKSYKWWHWRMMKNLKRNWLVASKLTQGIWQNLTWKLKSLKSYTLMHCFWPNYIMFELKKYRTVIFHDTRVWFILPRKIDLWVGKGHEEFGKFSPELTKVSKLGLSLAPLYKVENVWT